MPLLSARNTVTFPAEEYHHLLASTKLYCLVTEAHHAGVNNLPKVVAQQCLTRNRTSDATCGSQVRRSTRCATTSPSVCAAHLTDSGVLPFATLGSDGAPTALVVQRYKTVGETVRVSVCRAFADRRSCLVCIIANKAVWSTLLYL